MLNGLIPTIALTALLATGTLQAQQSTPSAEQVVKLMTSKLNLTDDQQHAIAPVIEERQARLKALRDEDAGRRQRRREARTILEDGDRKINAVLSPEQQQQYKELERQMIERLRARREPTP